MPEAIEKKKEGNRMVITDPCRFLMTLMILSLIAIMFGWVEPIE